jgi:nitrogen fixation NifU-like protein
MLYSETIRQRWRQPRFRGRLPGPDAAFEDVNPLCGDRIRMECRLDGWRLAEARFSGDACAIAVAAADVLVEMAEGQPVEALQALDARRILDRLGAEVRQSRMRCVALPLDVLKAALAAREVAR